MNRVCRKCGETKPLEEFHKNPDAVRGGPAGVRYAQEPLAGIGQRPIAARMTELQRRWRIENPESVREHERKYRHGNHEILRIRRAEYRKANKEKKASHTRVYYGIKTGRLVRPEVCEECCRDKDKIQGHHEDYANPYKVVWLCPKCHSARHREKSKPRQEIVTT